MAFTDNKPRTVTAPRETMVDVTLAAACEVGDLITYNSGWKLAVANTATMVLVALEAGAIGDVITASPFAVIHSITGMTAGGILRTAAAGAYAESTGTRVGYSASATEAVVLPLLTTATA